MKAVPSVAASNSVAARFPGTATIVGTILTAAVLALALGSCAKKDGTAAKKDGEAATAETVFAVATTTARLGQIADYLAVSGDVVASSTVDVFPDAAGKVSRLLVDIGSRVQKDQPIAEVDPSRPGMTFVPSPVKSPIAGTIVSLPAQLGGTVSPQVPVAKISTTGSLDIRCYIAERFVSKMRVGLGADLSLEAYPGRSFRAVVRELNPVIDPVSRTLEVKLSVVGSEVGLKSGMFAKVKIYTEEKAGVVTLPVGAVVKRSGDSFAFVVEKTAQGDVVRKRAVREGLLVDDRIEILEGISAGDAVVVRGQTLLDDGVKVNVVSSDAKTAK